MTPKERKGLQTYTAGQPPVGEYWLVAKGHQVRKCKVNVGRGIFAYNGHFYPLECCYGIGGKFVGPIPQGRGAE